MELVDPRLGSNYNKEEALRMIKVAVLCTNSSPELRPSMSSIVSMLVGNVCIQKLNPNLDIHKNDFFKSQGLKDAEIGSSSTSSEAFGDTSNGIKCGSSSLTSSHDHQLQKNAKH